MLTQRQQQVLDFINQCICERGYPPTMREIGEHMGIRSTNGVNDHLKALKKKGFLVRDEMKSRALRPVMGNTQVTDVPLLGQVAAGQPILATESFEDTLKIDRFFLGTAQEVFALRVKGDSMIEDGIFDGDFVFVKKQSSAQTGEIVVALIDDEATVKHYYPETEGICLKPANSAMLPIYIPYSSSHTFDLLGIVIGVYRKMKT